MEESNEPTVATSTEEDPEPVEEDTDIEECIFGELSEITFPLNNDGSRLLGCMICEIVFTMEEFCTHVNVCIGS